MKLRMRSKTASLHRRAWVLDGRGNALYQIHSKLASLHDTTFVERANGDPVATISRSPVSLHETHLLEMEDGTAVQLRAQLLHLTKDVLDIEELGWHLVGNLVQHDYWLMDRDGQMLAQAHRKWMSLHNTYEIEVEDESQLDSIIAVVAALDRIVEERRRVMGAPGPTQEG